MFYQKAAVMDTLVFKPCFLRLYAPLCIHPSGMRAKPCVTWLFVGKILELPEAKYLCIKKRGNSKHFFKMLLPRHVHHVTRA